MILDCDYNIVRDLIVHHVNDIYMGRRMYLIDDNLQKFLTLKSNSFFLK